MLTRRNLPARVVAALAATAVLAVAGCSGGGDSNTFTYKSATVVGKLIPVADRKPAEDFSGDLLDGKNVSLSTTKGKVTLINFWATWCPPCRVESPQLDSFYRAMKGKGVTVLGIDVKDLKSKAKSFVQTNHISYPIVYDQQGEAALKLGNPPANLPFTYLLDKKGRVAAIYLGGLTGKDLQGPVDKLLAADT